MFELDSEVGSVARLKNKIKARNRGLERSILKGN